MIRKETSQTIVLTILVTISITRKFICNSNFSKMKYAVRFTADLSQTSAKIRSVTIKIIQLGSSICIPLWLESQLH